MTDRPSPDRRLSDRRLSRTEPGLPPLQPRPRSAAAPAAVGLPPALPAAPPADASRSIPAGQPQTLINGAPAPPRRRSRRLPAWMRTWWFWVMMGSMGFTTVALLAAAILFRLPALPNCPAIFWPMASASMRLYCAELAANKGTLDDYLEAIALVDGLPADHELRPQVNAYLEQWTQDALDLAEEVFQAGDLDKAISTAERIPRGIFSAELMAERVARWREIWTGATKHYDTALGLVDQSQWGAALGEANQLTSVPNRFWASVKYDELRTLIGEARQDDVRIRQAETLADQGGIENFRQAFDLLAEIEPERRMYAKAQKTIAYIADQAVDFAIARLRAKDPEPVFDVVLLLPDRVSLQAKAAQLETLARAQRSANAGRVEDLELAVSQASQVKPGDLLYAEAQTWIARWEQDQQDVVALGRARMLAQGGDVGDLADAIATAQSIANASSLYQEAQQEIGDWSNRMQTLRDRPRLNQAEVLAGRGTYEGYQAAIAQASAIRRDSPLHDEARSRIRNWSAAIAQMRDRPILSRAQQAAATGNLSGAIQLLGQIPADSTLAGEAQDYRDRWQAQIDGQRQLSRAQATAQAGTPSALVAAMRTANQISRRSTLREQASANIDRWGRQLLALAQERATYDLGGAIAIARQVPNYAPTYADAQRDIERWEALRSPPTPVSPPTPSAPPSNILPTPALPPLLPTSESESESDPSPTPGEW